jgi:dephospho-CoA kinase
MVTRVAAAKGEVSILRGKPRHSTEIANLINRLKKPAVLVTKEDVMGMFGEKAILLLQSGENLLGMVGWQVENLIARTIDILIDPYLKMEDALPPLIQEMEQASRVLQCEASLVFLSQEMAQYEPLWRSLGYERRAPTSLGVLAWQEAAQESMQEGSVIYFKQLRMDRVLRPI